MSKQAEADLILKLYDLRREPTMRAARQWFVTECNPQSDAEYRALMLGPNGAYLRMVVSYWEMAAALVHHGAIDIQLFTDTSPEFFVVFVKLEPLLNEIRSVVGPDFLKNLEKLIDDTPGGRQRVAATRQMMQAMAAARRQAQSDSAPAAT